MEKHSNINNQFIPYEQALELKELGLDEPCFAFYGLSRDDYKTIRLSIFQNLKTDYLSDVHHLDVTCDAPLYQQAFLYLWNKTGRYIIPIPNDDKEWLCMGNKFKTYEETRLECLKTLIEIIKNEYK